MRVRAYGLPGVAIACGDTRRPANEAAGRVWPPAIAPGVSARVSAQPIAGAVRAAYRRSR